MPSIGNDIVDLTALENRGKSRDGRFLDRVFTHDEQDLIRQANQWADAVLWAIWAGKEGAFKAISKSIPDFPSSPRQYNVKFNNQDLGSCLCGIDPIELPGVVETPAGDVSFRTLFAPDYVHCLAMIGACRPDERMISQVIPLDEGMDGSFRLRKAAVDRIAAVLDMPSTSISIHRSRTAVGDGPPYVLAGGLKTNVDISLSHDGRFGAFALYFAALIASLNQR